MGKFEEMKEKHPRGMIVVQGFWILIISTVFSFILITPLHIFGVPTEILVDFFTYPVDIIPQPFNLFGLLLISVGFLFIIWANYALLHIGKLSLRNREPMQNPESFVLVGPYRYSRNPLYLGILLGLVGLVIIWSSVVTAILTVLVYFIFGNIFIEKEERILEEEFGDEYRDFKKRVRRWL